jgi:hypothetical protein
MIIINKITTLQRRVQGEIISKSRREMGMVRGGTKGVIEGGKGREGKGESKRERVKGRE